MLNRFANLPPVGLREVYLFVSLSQTMAASGAGQR
jgi:hypothetical protein